MRCVPRFLAALAARRGAPLHPSELEDLVQDALFQIWRRLASFEGWAALETWSYRFCQHTLSSHLRARRRGLARPPHDEVGDGVAAEHPDYGWIHELLERVSEANARIVRLRHFEQRTFAQIAAELELPESTVKARYQRALQRLRSFLRERGEP